MTNIQKDEYFAWLRVVEILRDLGIDINKHDNLNTALKDWAMFNYFLIKEKGGDNK